MLSAPTRCGIARVPWNSAVIRARPPTRRTSSASPTPSTDAMSVDRPATLRVSHNDAEKAGSVSTAR